MNTTIKQTEARHTPGPWQVTPAGGISNGTEIVILNVFDKEREAFAMNNGFGNAAENAALISAAPELLEACEALLLHFPATNDPSDKLCLKQARAAIAKAKGSK